MQRPHSARPFFVTTASLFCLAIGVGCSGTMGTGFPSSGSQTGVLPQQQQQQTGAQANIPAPQPTPAPKTVAKRLTLSPASAVKAPNVVDGFSASIDLSPIEPTPAPTPAPQAPQMSRGARRPAPTPSPTPSPSATPDVIGATAAPASSSSPGSPPTADVEVTIYPNDAPKPDASPGVPAQHPLVRLAVTPQSDLALRGLSAFTFSVPAVETAGARSFAVALFEKKKRHKYTSLAFMREGVHVSGSAIVPGPSAPLTLKKGTAYAIVLYGDERPATPAPATPTPGPAGGFPSIAPQSFGTPLPGTSMSPLNGFQTPRPFGQ